MCDERLWRPQAEALPFSATYGNTTQAEDFGDMARQVIEVAPKRFALVGLSMGGILAFEVWRQAPERVTHMALLDTNPHVDTPERKSMRIQQVETALAGGLRELAVDSLKPLYLADSNREDRTLLTTILDMALALGPEVFRRQSAALRKRIDSVPTLASIDCPALVLCGAEDRLCPVEYHEFMAARIPDARLRIVDDCGHLSSLEQPAAVNEELRRLLAR